jgi:hypothetical protein
LAQPIFACSDDKKQALITKPLKSWPYGHLDGALPYLDVANPFIVVDAPDRAPAGGPTENIQVGLASRTFITILPFGPVDHKNVWQAPAPETSVPPASVT